MQLCLTIQKSARLLSTIMLAYDVLEREDEPEMANVLTNLAVPQKLAQKDIDNTNIIQSNQDAANPSKEEVTNPKYTP
jgi:hypothetical protein